MSKNHMTFSRDIDELGRSNSAVTFKFVLRKF